MDGSELTILEANTDQTAMKISTTLSLRPVNPSVEPYTGKTKANCPLCHVSILKRTLPRHMRTAHGGARKKFACPFCDLSFARKDSCERHQREQHTNNEQSITCGICGSSVNLRSLRDHFQTRKCMAIRAKAGYDPLALPFYQQPEKLSTLDPLVIAASFNRLALHAWWALEPLFHPSEFTNTGSIVLGPPTTLNTGEERKVPQAMDDGHRLRAVFDLPFTSDVWRLRDVALAQTRKMIEMKRKRSNSSADSQLHDDNIIRVALIYVTDQLIFGKTSMESQTHARGLANLLESKRTTSKFVPRFEELLAHVWREYSAVFQDMVKHRTEPLLARFVYGCSLALGFQYDFGLGAWIIRDLDEFSPPAMAHNSTFRLHVRRRGQHTVSAAVEMSDKCEGSTKIPSHLA